MDWKAVGRPGVDLAGVPGSTVGASAPTAVRVATMAGWFARNVSAARPSMSQRLTPPPLPDRLAVDSFVPDSMPGLSHPRALWRA
jgi:hypothetical protein